MNDLWNKLLDFILGPEAIMADPGFDPTNEPLKARAKRKTFLLLGLLVGVPLLCIGGSLGAVRAIAASQFTPTNTATRTPEPYNPDLPPPGIVITTTVSTADAENILTVMADLPSETATATPTATATKLTVDTILTSIVGSSTPVTTIPATVAATKAQIADGTPNVIVVIASPTWTPWIITVTPSVTPYPTYTPFPTHTFTPYPTYTKYPTYTPWILLTQPPATYIATIIVVQTVEVTREVTVPVTVVVTATPTETYTPTETATPTETPTSTATETPTP